MTKTNPHVEDFDAVLDTLHAAGGTIETSNDCFRARLRGLASRAGALR
jgi:hypothetical protein